MKTIGLIGGMSWESTALYYRILNEETRRLRGGLHSAPIAMVSVDFHLIERLQMAGDWEGAARELVDAGRRVESAGADVLLICTNTMHKLADQVQAAVDIPLLNLADATAERIRAAGMDRVGLLGTRFTMEQDFYRGRLEARGLNVITPTESDRALVHDVIYGELCLGRVDASSRIEYLRIIDDMVGAGAQGIIEGCTEIALLVGPEHTPIPLFDTTRIHAEAAVSWALSQ